MDFSYRTFFVQNPGAGQVEILEATANKPDTVFNSQIYLIQGLLQDIYVIENPVVLQADLQQPPLSFYCQELIHSI